MSVNKATLDLIKRYEGCKLTAYQCSAGIWTIGYGTTAVADLGITPAKGMTITQERAEDLLRQGVDKFAATVDAILSTRRLQSRRCAHVLSKEFEPWQVNTHHPTCYLTHVHSHPDT